MCLDRGVRAGAWRENLGQGAWDAWRLADSGVRGGLTAGPVSRVAVCNTLPSLGSGGSGAPA